MTDDLLARAQQALERITPAPWTQVGFGNIHAEPVGDHPPVAKTWNRANGDFIAAARTLVPELADALKAARDENERLRGEHARVRALCNRNLDQGLAIAIAEILDSDRQTP